MSNKRLIAHLRNDAGKKASRELRRTGKIPAVLYGAGSAKTVHLEMEEESTRHYLQQLTAVHQLLPLAIVQIDQTIETHNVLLQAVQKHSYQIKLLHLDFRKPALGKSIPLRVPLKTVGLSPGIKKGGVLQMVVRDVPVTCTPENIPDYITLDVSSLDFGGNLRIQDVNVPPNVYLGAKVNYSIASIVGRAARIAASESME